MKRFATILTAAALLAAPACAEGIQTPEFTVVNVEACAVDQATAVASRCGAVDHKIIIDDSLMAANPGILEFAVSDDDGNLWLPKWHVIAWQTPD